MISSPREHSRNCHHPHKIAPARHLLLNTKSTHFPFFVTAPTGSMTHQRVGRHTGAMQTRPRPHFPENINRLIVFHLLVSSTTFYSSQNLHLSLQAMNANRNEFRSTSATPRLASFGASDRIAPLASAPSEIGQNSLGNFPSHPYSSPRQTGQRKEISTTHKSSAHRHISMKQSTMPTRRSRPPPSNQKISQSQSLTSSPSP